MRGGRVSSARVSPLRAEAPGTGCGKGWSAGVMRQPPSSDRALRTGAMPDAHRAERSMDRIRCCGCSSGFCRAKTSHTRAKSASVSSITSGTGPGSTASRSAGRRTITEVRSTSGCAGSTTTTGMVCGPGRPSAGMPDKSASGISCSTAVLPSPSSSSPAVVPGRASKMSPSSAGDAAGTAGRLSCACRGTGAASMPMQTTRDATRTATGAATGREARGLARTQAWLGERKNGNWSKMRMRLPFPVARLWFHFGCRPVRPLTPFGTRIFRMRIERLRGRNTHVLGSVPVLRLTSRCAPRTRLTDADRWRGSRRADGPARPRRCGGNCGHSLRG